MCKKKGKDMKTLIFNGSPREDGCTAYLTNLLKEKLTGEVKVVRTHMAGIHPCSDCRTCWEKFGCPIEDGMQEIYEYIRESDNIVIASPLYFSEATGTLLSVMSRLQMFYSAEKFLKAAPVPKEKKGAVILCGGGTGGADRAEATAKLLLKTMHARHVLTVASLHTDTLPADRDGSAVRGVLDLAAKLNGNA